MDIEEEAKRGRYNKMILAGCGSVLLVFLFVMAALLMKVISLDRQAAQYPGSTPTSSHSNYKGLPMQYRWDDAYRTTDNFAAVYNWYSITFDLGAEQRANGRCNYLEGTKKQFIAQRTISVFLCNTDEGQLIYVSRTTSFR